MLLYAVSRFIIEFYRGDPRGIVFGMFSTSQFISLVLVPLSLVMLVVLGAARRGAGAAPRRSAAARAALRPRMTDATHRSFVVDAGARRRRGSTASSPRVLPDQSRSQIQRLIKDGQVHVARASSAAPSTPVRAGQTRRDRRPGAARRPRPTPRTLPLDDPLRGRRPGRRRQAGRHGRAPGGRPRAAARWSTRCCTTCKDLSGIGGELRPGIVHRLDRGTSGLMVVAKNDAAHQELARQFHDREVEKEYVALVWGVVQAGRRIDAPIGRDPERPAEDVDARAPRARRR